MSQYYHTERLLASSDRAVFCINVKINVFENMRTFSATFGARYSICSLVTMPRYLVSRQQVQISTRLLIEGFLPVDGFRFVRKANEIKGFRVLTV